MDRNVVRELSLWKERYPGALSATEEAFARAAASLAGRKRRRHRVAVAAAFAVLLAAVGVVTSFWRRSVLEVSRREAAQILALGRLDLGDRPTAALAHALASLERADNEPARRFAVEALWHGAAAIVIPDNLNSVDFSPNGKWLGGGGSVMGVRLWSIEGGSPKALGGPGAVPPVTFSPGSDLLAAGGRKTVRFWSLPEGNEIRNVELEGDTYFRRGGSHLLSVTATSERTESIRHWSLQGDDRGILSSLDLSGVQDWDIDASGDWLITARGKGVYISPLRDTSPDRARLIGKHEANILRVRAHPTATRILSADETGEIRIWEASGLLVRTFHAPAPQVRLDPTDSWMVATPVGPHTTPDVAYVWDLKGPPDADPIVLRNGNVTFLNSAAIDPLGHWLVTANAALGILWPLQQKYSRVLHGQPPLKSRSLSPPTGVDWFRLHSTTVLSNSGRSRLGKAREAAS